MQPPSKRYRDIAARKKNGALVAAIAREFKTTTFIVRKAIQHVERYNRGMQILQDNPASIEGLELSGKLHTLAAKSLYAHGYRTLYDLDGLTLVDPLVMPNLGRRDAEMLVRLAAEAKLAVKRGGSGGERNA